MKKALITAGAIGILIIIISGVYFFVLKSRTDDLTLQKNKLEQALNVAQKNLNKEKEKLDTLNKGLQDSFPLAVSVQGQMKKSFDIVQQTDFMFYDAYGLNPELIIKNYSTASALNNERKDINSLLLKWQKQLNLLSVQKIDVNESEKIKKDIETIKVFIKNLTLAIKALTVQNSGLSQYQIDTYSAQFVSVEVVDEVIYSIETAITNSNYNSLNSNATNSYTVATGNSQVPANFETFPGQVLPSEVITQQSVVEEAQNQVNQIQEQIAQVEAQIQQASTIPPASEIPTEIIVNPPIEDTSMIEYLNLPPRKIIKDQGILVQPGPPRLIQGSDPY